MLARKVEVFMYTSTDEDLMVGVKACKSSLHVDKGILCDVGFTGQVAEINKRGDAFDNIVFNVLRNSWQKNLHNV